MKQYTLKKKNLCDYYMPAIVLGNMSTVVEKRDQVGNNHSENQDKNELVFYPNQGTKFNGKKNANCGIISLGQGKGVLKL